MKPNWKDLTKILKPFVDAEVGETGDCPELDEVLREVVSWKVLMEAKLREEVKKLREVAKIQTTQLHRQCLEGRARFLERELLGVGADET